MGRRRHKTSGFRRETGPRPGLASRSEGRSSRVLLAVLTGIVAVVVLAAHWPALSAGALALDDHDYLSRNDLVQQPGWASAGRFLSEVVSPSTVTGYYQPLPMISLMLDYASGGRPDHLRPFHRTSLVLHVINTVLVIVFLQMLFGRPWIAAIVGLLFGVHPLAVEPVSLVGERKTLLSACFALACLVLYVRHARRGGRFVYGLSLVSFILALLSKPTATPLPLVMLALDFWPLRRVSRRTVVEKTPFLGIAIVSGVITIISQHHLEWSAVNSFSAGQSLLLACHNVVFYLWKMLWPAHLSPFYPFPSDVSLSSGVLLAAVVITAALVVALLISLRRTPALLLGWLCFFFLLSPTLLNKSYSPCIAWDRYVYLPSIGLLMVLVWLLGEMWERASRQPRLRFARAGIMCAAAGLVAALVCTTRGQFVHWQTTEGLYEYMLGLAPEAHTLHYNFGLILSGQGRLAEAASHYEEALRLKPDLQDGDNNLGNTLVRLGRTDEAMVHFRRAQQLVPCDPKADNNIANVLSAQGKLDQAVEHYSRALSLDPRFAEAHNNLAIALVSQGKRDRAVEHYRQALDAAPRFAEAHSNLAVALAAQGNVDEAIEHYTRAIEINPAFVEAHQNLGLALAGRGKIDAAIGQYREALRLRPDDAKIHGLLALALEKAGRTTEANQHHAEAARLDAAHAGPKPNAVPQAERERSGGPVRQ